MKKNLLWLILSVALAVQAAPSDPAPLAARELQPLPHQPHAAHLAASVLDRYHYRAAVLDDALSEKIFDQYFKALDPDRLFFTQTDLDRWADARTKLDDAILGEDLSIPFAIYNRYTQRVAERYSHGRKLLQAGFDFSQQESYDYLRDKAPWPGSDAEANELWRQRVKNDWLQLKLAGKDDKACASTLDKRYENFLKRVARSKSEDAFQAFMNAYTTVLDPHSSYLGARAAEAFDIAMKLSLVGIGAALEEKDDYAVIRELVPGSPAALSRKLKAGDRIIGVGQGEQGTMTDVIGWRLDDTVALIRGEANSVVRLDVLPAASDPDGKHGEIRLVRKKISLEEQAAKKSILTVSVGKGTQRIGVIALPGFYQDFEARQKGDKNYRSATRDVARLLQELRQEKVDAVLMDLRNNGGGSLTEAIDLCGLFIDTGPVVMSRDAQGRVSVGMDNHPGTAWDGPLGVLINRGSASASEIFAAAMQDYQRGLVIGESSFGKGTVQTLLDLNEVDKSSDANPPKLGELKLTIAQFFRINGGTTQQRGVMPDIALPSFADLEHFGESSYSNALPWTRIRPLDYASLSRLSDLLPQLEARHGARIDSDKEFRFLREDIAELDAQRRKHSLSLNETERRFDRERREARLKLRREAGAGGNDAALALNEDDEADSDNGKKPKNAKDLLLTEAARILGDEVELLHSHPNLAARTTPDSRSLLR